MQGLMVEPGQNNVAAGHKATNQRIQQVRRPADVCDNAVVATSVCVRRKDLVAGSAAVTLRIGLPDHRRRAAEGYHRTRQQRGHPGAP